MKKARNIPQGMLLVKPVEGRLVQEFRAATIKKAKYVGYKRNEEGLWVIDETALKDGVLVEDNRYYRNRLNDGDLISMHA